MAKKRITIVGLEKKDIHPTIVWRPGHNDYILELSDKPYRRIMIGTFKTYNECVNAIIDYVTKNGLV